MGALLLVKPYYEAWADSVSEPLPLQSGDVTDELQGAHIFRYWSPFNAFNYIASG